MIIPGLAPGMDEARTIIRDPQDGNVLVAGRVRLPAGPVFAVFKLDANTGMVLWPASVADFPYQTLRLVLLPCGLEQSPYEIASHLTFPTTTTLYLG